MLRSAARFSCKAQVHGMAERSQEGWCAVPLVVVNAVVILIKLLF